VTPKGVVDDIDIDSPGFSVIRFHGIVDTSSAATQ
jgi:hypothetical protein